MAKLVKNLAMKKAKDEAKAVQEQFQKLDERPSFMGGGEAITNTMETMELVVFAIKMLESVSGAVARKLKCAFDAYFKGAIEFVKSQRKPAKALVPADVHTAGLKAAVDEKELPASALAAKKLAARDAFCGLAKKEAGEMYKRKRARRKVAKFLAEVGIGAEHQKIVSDEVKKLCEKFAGTVADVLYDEAQAGN